MRSYPYKCTYCARTGKYKAREIGIALDFRCPHDGSKLTFQEPILMIDAGSENGIQVIEAPALVKEVIEFVHHLSDAIVSKLRNA